MKSASGSSDASSFGSMQSIVAGVTGCCKYSNGLALTVLTSVYRLLVTDVKRVNSL